MSTAFADATRELLLSATAPEPQRVFDPNTLDDLPAAAQRLLTRALPPGVPLLSTVELTMEGEIKLGRRWLPFIAQQVLRAGVGFVWAPTVGGRILRFTGADVLGPCGAQIDFRFRGLIPVARDSGHHVTRSARGRLAAETVAWLPQALTPQAGAIWAAGDNETATVTIRAAGHPTDVNVAVDADGQLSWLALKRWNESVKPPAFAAFGGSTNHLYTTSDGVAISGGGRVGWDWGTPQQADGDFFHYTITAARFVRSESTNATTSEASD